MNQFSLPARLSFEEAITTNLSKGHENEGSLSEEYGFLPATPPLQNLPPPIKSGMRLRPVYLNYSGSFRSGQL